MRSIYRTATITIVPTATAREGSFHIFDETLCRKLPNGNPNFSEPEMFPTVWAEGVRWTSST